MGLAQGCFNRLQNRLGHRRGAEFGARRLPNAVRRPAILTKAVRTSLRREHRPAALQSPWPPSHLGAMTADVSVLAALFAGLISFLSPCVLPLVPPYLIYLAGASMERLPRRAARWSSATTVVAALLSWPGSRPCSWRWRRRQRGRRDAARLFRRALDRRRHRHHHHGAALPRADADCVAQIGRRARDASRSGCGAPMPWASPSRSAGRRASGRSSRRSSRCGVGGDGGEGAGLLAVYSLGLGVPFLLAALAVEPFAAFLARFEASWSMSRRRWGVAGAHRPRVPGRLLSRSQLSGRSRPSRRCSRLDRPNETATPGCGAAAPVSNRSRCFKTGYAAVSGSLRRLGDLAASVLLQAFIT